MRIIRSSHYQRMPWKNGGGETVQIAIDDQARGLEDFTWRISMARVESDGPFSLFPGIDRTLCILQGDSMALTLGGRETVRLDQASAPFYFPADVPAGAQLSHGGITDLNVMTRRGRARHFVSRLSGGLSMKVAAQGDVLMVLSWGGACGLQGAGPGIRLADHDFAILAADETPIEVTPEGRLYLIDLWLT